MWDRNQLPLTYDLPAATRSKARRKTSEPNSEGDGTGTDEFIGRAGSVGIDSITESVPCSSRRSVDGGDEVTWGARSFGGGWETSGPGSVTVYGPSSGSVLIVMVKQNHETVGPRSYHYRSMLLIYSSVLAHWKEFWPTLTSEPSWNHFRWTKSPVQLMMNRFQIQYQRLTKQNKKWTPSIFKLFLSLTFYNTFEHSSYFLKNNFFII
jgi:hypothetical protein